MEIRLDIPIPESADDKMGVKQTRTPIPWPGFTALSSQVYVHDATAADRSAANVSPGDPTLIILFGWGDGTPKNVGKYADGFHKLFPAARIIGIISLTRDAVSHSTEDKIEAMDVLVSAAFPTAEAAAKERTLIQVMSNTGGIYLAAMLEAYQRRYGRDAKIPHQLAISDSTPGGLSLWSDGVRWSRAMALGVAKVLPLPFVVTHGLCYAFLCVNQGIEYLMGREHAGVWATRIINDLNVVGPESHRLYMYSKEDDLIGWQDVEAGAAAAKQLGHPIHLEMFEGSAHVAHMRDHPEQYWGAIEKTWKEATGQGSA
ncbi:hypothetical protein BX600DRAFT_468452 [Xylariales sp. PMI_506]|nr:hypothetical protein BX600DRAFT_468452 [Xylariales sp. PMI_506]